MVRAASSRFTLNRILSHLRMVFEPPGFFGLLCANVALGMAYSFVVPFMSLWGTEHVGMSHVGFGTFMTLTALSAIVLSTVLARWSDTHVPRRPMLILGSLGGILGYVGYAFVREPWILTVIGCIALGVSTVNFSQVFAHMREEFNRPELAHLDAPYLMSLLRISFSLAWTVGPAIGAWVMNQYGYRGIFLGAAGLYGLFLLGVLLFVPHRSHPPAAHAAKRESVLQALTRKDILFSFTAFVLVFSAHSISLLNLPLMVKEDMGGTVANIGIIYGVAPFAEMPLMLWSGRAASRGHMMPLLRVGALATVAYFLAVSFVRTPQQIYPMQILSAVSIAILTNVTIPFYQELLPTQPGLATTIYSNSFSAGSLVGYFAFGLLVGVCGHRGLFYVCAGLSLITFVILIFYRHRPRPTGPVIEEPVASITGQPV